MNIDFKIKNNHWYLRWKNWKNFLKEKIISNKNISNKNVVVFVTFNNSYDTLKLLNIFLNKEERKDFDIIIVDNNSNSEHFSKLKDYVLNKKERKLILLQTADNLWGGGWYALWLEYILSKNYDYVTVTEDDAFPLQDNTLSWILDNSNSKTEILIKYKDLNTTSFSLHFHWYPVYLIKEAWVLDPRYFMRSYDLEWALRINKKRKKLNINIKFVDLFYTHPVIKKWWNKFWQIYLWQRNSFFTESRYKFNVKIFIITFLYLWFWFSKFLLEKDFRYIKYLIIAYFDFIFVNFWYKKNKLILEKLFKEKDNFYSKSNFQKISINDFNKKYNNSFLFAISISFLKNKIKFSRKKLNFFHWTIISWYNSPLYPLFILSKKNISIEEIDWDNLIILKKENKWLYRFIAIIFSFILWLLLYFIFLPFLIIRYLIWKIFKL